MVVLDGTITNIALPSIQEDLGVSAANLAWVVNAYALAFGGLLLLGGKSGDLFGRRRMFRAGIALFALASAAGGFATGEAWLIAARVLQGIGGAIAAPTALSLIAVNFAAGAPRNRAMGVYAAMAGTGATVGLLLGGVLTDYLSWRWVFFVNVPIALVVLLGSTAIVEGERNRGRLDVPGAILGSAGLLALVFGITRAGDTGWQDTGTLSVFVASGALLAAFIVWQMRTMDPMLPLALFSSRGRSGSYATMLFLGAGMFATFYFLTLYLQQILGFSPVKTGLAFLPFSLGMGVAAAVSSKLAARLAPRWIVAPGLLIAAGGMYWFSTIDVESSYWTYLMPAMFSTAVGLGLGFVPLTLGAVSGVPEQNTGIASALLNTAQQVGGALGLATLSTLATSTTGRDFPDATASLYRGYATQDFALVRTAADALTHGYSVAFTVTVGLFVIGAAVAALAVNTAKPDRDHVQARSRRAEERM
ncbi:MFS transporter [Mycobacterium avium]|nr:MFS transporter [Mycobacterium avium]PBA89820.1 MFS transporter [Mycobacterium avium]PBJ47006.1 MFS transporter [Mycobacterium avium subsp. hominissuis]